MSDFRGVLLILCEPEDFMHRIKASSDSGEVDCREAARRREKQPSGLFGGRLGEAMRPEKYVLAV